MDAETIQELKRLRERAVDAERKLATYDGEDGCAEYHGLYLRATHARSSYLGLLESLAPALIAAAEREHGFPASTIPPEGQEAVVLLRNGEKKYAWSTWWHGHNPRFAEWTFPEGDSESQAAQVIKWFPIRPAPGAQP